MQDSQESDAKIAYLQGSAASLAASSTADLVAVCQEGIWGRAGNLPAGAATLRLEYRGGFSPGLRGLYRAGGIAVTQFEAADARRLFPCFDEPAFKASWELALSATKDESVRARIKDHLLSLL